MSDLQIFDFESNDVRTVLIDGEPWFVAKDVCNILEIKNSRDALSSVDEEDKLGVGIPDPHGRTQTTTVINESGLYQLIFKSRKAEAKQFKRWVTSKVLPTLRKTGSYSLSQKGLKPQYSAVDYAQAADTAQKLSNPMMKSLVEQRLMEELSANSLPSNSSSSQPEMVILTVRAKELGYPESAIGTGSRLGKYVSKRIKPVGKQQHGRYPVNTYELNPDLDKVIHSFFV